ncbi:Predicted small integral membrane protein [Actinopolyspora xinjiangensis]|uniref:Predicted small integral membrane protein n=1 Tax=Actinopolyspora xinjiangensis TaxID=405564 RepID=A0A1H0PC67_9ACTN|nr:DUF2165 family protein [Actinopolyspora xinjiangensis]SDP02594.1 Predicted small integral membrane protein [Actinopolyspora xinjiangensis]
MSFPLAESSSSVDTGQPQERVPTNTLLTAWTARRSGLLPLVLFLFAGVAAWLTLIAVNNITDFGTNRVLLERTMTMRALIDDQVRGNGLEWRALPASLATPALITVIVYQLGTVVLMWRAVITGLRVLRSPRRGLAELIRHVNHSLVAFVGLFLGFLVSGLWFGYWMHLGPVQQVHFTLLMVGALVALLTNLLPVAARPLVPEVTR